MALLDHGEVAKQFANVDVLRRLRRLDVEALRIRLHRLGLVADGLERQVLHQPGRAAAQKSLDVLATDRRQVLAETRLVDLKQGAAMLVLLGRHFLEDFCRRGIAFGEFFGETEVDSAVFFLRGDGDGQDFAFGRSEKFFKAMRFASPSGGGGVNWGLISIGRSARSF